MPSRTLLKLVGPSAIDVECPCQTGSPRSVLDSVSDSKSADEASARRVLSGAVIRMGSTRGIFGAALDKASRRRRDEACMPLDPLAPKLSARGRYPVGAAHEPVGTSEKSEKTGWFWGRHNRREENSSNALEVSVPSRRARSEATSPTEIRSKTLSPPTANAPPTPKAPNSRSWGGVGGRWTSRSSSPSPLSPSLQAIEEREGSLVEDPRSRRFSSPFRARARSSSPVPRNVAVKPAMLDTQALNRSPSPALPSPLQNLGRSPILGRRAIGGEWAGGRQRKAAGSDARPGTVKTGVIHEDPKKQLQIQNEYVLEAAPSQSLSSAIRAGGSKQEYISHSQDVSSIPSSFRSPSAKSSRDQNEYVLDPLSTSPLSSSSIPGWWGNKNENTAPAPYPHLSPAGPIHPATLFSPEDFTVLIGLLESRTLVARRKAAATIRDMTRTSASVREGLGEAGVVPPLVALMTAVDAELVEHVALAACNLAVGNKMNKTRMVTCGAIPSLVRLLQAPSMTVREASTAALLTLATEEEHKATLGEAGAIPLLTAVLSQGSSQGQQDAAHTLYNLVGCDSNLELVLNAKPVPALLEVILKYPKTRGAERAVAVIYTLTAVEEGRVALTEAPNAVPALVQEIQWGSERGKEVAIAALLTACLNSRRCRHMAVEMGAVAVLLGLVACSNSRTADKIRSLLRCLERAGSAPVVMVSSAVTTAPASPLFEGWGSGSGSLLSQSYSDPSHVGIAEGGVEFSISNQMVRDMVKESMEGARKSIRIRANLPHH